MSPARLARSSPTPPALHPGPTTRPAPTPRRPPAFRHPAPGRRVRPRCSATDGGVPEPGGGRRPNLGATPMSDPAESGDETGGAPWVPLVEADVLVVDDDADVRTSMAAVLRGSGFEVIEAVDGETALATLRATRVGVLLLDLHMTPRDGVWLLERLDEPPVVILVSAFALYPESDMRSRFSDVVTHFVQKPVAPAKLIDLVRASLVGGS